MSSNPSACHLNIARLWDQLAAVTVHKRSLPVVKRQDPKCILQFLERDNASEIYRVEKEDFRNIRDATSPPKVITDLELSPKIGTVLELSPKCDVKIRKLDLDDDKVLEKEDKVDKDVRESDISSKPAADVEVNHENHEKRKKVKMITKNQLSNSKARKRKSENEDSVDGIGKPKRGRKKRNTEPLGKVETMNIGNETFNSSLLSPRVSPAPEDLPLDLSKKGVSPPPKMLPEHFHPAFHGGFPMPPHMMNFNPFNPALFRPGSHGPLFHPSAYHHFHSSGLPSPPLPLGYTGVPPYHLW